MQDPHDPPLSDDELADEISTLAAHLSAAMARWLAHVADFDARRVWASWGCASCAHWLAWRCSIAPSAAREHVRVARALTALPLVQAAFARGELSYSKVRALTRLGAVEHEEGLLELALVHTAAQLERVVRATRRVDRERAEIAYAERFLVLDPEGDGTVAIRGRLTADDAAVLQRALDLAREALHAEGVPDEATAANLGADALVRLADSVLVTGPSGRATADRHEVVVHVDADALTAADEAPATCAVEGDVPIARETARRLCCDAGIVTQLERGGEPLAVGRRMRTVPPAIRRALRARGDRCGFPGCTATKWLDAHHVVHWADGGPTDLDNLVLLCAHHHKLVHECGYRIEATAPTDTAASGERRFRGSAPRSNARGRRREFCFLTPYGRRLEPVPATSGGDVAALRDRHRRAGIDPGPDTAAPGWIGESFHLDASLDAVRSQLRRSADEPPADEPPADEPPAEPLAA